MSRQKDEFTIEYNDAYDVLYIKIKNSYDTYVEERHKGILINHDYKTDEITGLEIWDFKRRIEKKEKMETPFPVDLEVIFKTLVH